MEPGRLTLPLTGHHSALTFAHGDHLCSPRHLLPPFPDSLTRPHYGLPVLAHKGRIPSPPFPLGLPLPSVISPDLQGDLWLANSPALSSFVFSIFVQRTARFRCCAEPSSQEQDTAAAPPTLPPAKESTSSLLGISTSTWSAGVAGLGFLETGYLTYLKLTGSEAFCPISGGGCGDVLDSDYSAIFGKLL